MLTSDKLPGIEVKSVFLNKDDLFLCKAEAQDGLYSIYKDGSILVFFEIAEGAFERGFVQNLVSVLLESDAIGKERIGVQIFKVVDENEVVKYFGGIKVSVDYSFLKVRLKNSFRRFFVGFKDILEQFERVVDVMDGVVDKLSDIKIIKLQRVLNPVYKFLLDCEDNVELKVIDVPEVDVSVLKLKNRSLGMFSLADIVGLAGGGVLKHEKNYLQIFSFCIGSEKHKDKMENYFSSLYNLISVVDSAESEEVKINKFEKRILCFYNNTIVLSDRHEKLDDRMKIFKDMLFNNGVISYTHTTSADLNYLSCLPGNADCGYYYQICCDTELVKIAENFLKI